MHQTPKQVWAHRNQLTEYQVWVAYRVAVRQLSLYHEGKKHDSSCRKPAACQGRKETMEHIFWECSCAQACWVKLIQQWTGEAWEPQNIESFQLSCANRKAPPVTPSLVEKMQKTYPDDIKHIILEWKRIWHILCTICLTSLWTQRNRVVFQQAQVTEDSSATEFWGTAMRQLRALGKRECRQPETQLRGTHLLLCLRVLEQKPREHPRQRVSPEQPLDLQEEPALLTRLRKYQTASRR
ncbi:uncharacterized protein PITG_01197 [Phytophthora infestans T30-4]|uniref:Reverse transcriptase zinc-binding domain-containing protein n=1 Tax=Phytophthora infestans (strain T30-4) TaxID=403677 RepID=D0MUW0_PHYIT|nr:uncharacterized protein PITG_01197 [Phytophthora infestans T30-4]EEY60956.1 conserved hypothetical protein [Phytophthora infestans T30-4]|eukprot:XP_002907873.1 conserved hypothetical protein [Phytophthora infestans T30-4]